MFHMEIVMVKDPTGALVQLYLAQDATQKQVSTEILTKKLGEILLREGITNVDLKSYAGQVLVAWQSLPLASVKPKSEVGLFRDAAYRDKLGIDKDRVSDLLLAATPPSSPPIQSSS